LIGTERRMRMKLQKRGEAVRLFVSSEQRKKKQRGKKRRERIGMCL
jgi:hypothetical protein